MKIAVLLGSPHKNGSSNMLANEFVRGAKEAGHEVEILDAAHLKMNPCLGCEYCGKTKIQNCCGKIKFSEQ